MTSPDEKNRLNTTLAMAFRTLAGWSSSPTNMPTDIASKGLPLVVADTRFALPTAVVADLLVARSGRDTIVIEAELRGRLPHFSIAVGRPEQDMPSSHSAYVPWLSIDGRVLWLVSAYTPHPDIPFYRLDGDGLHQGEVLPWTQHEDRPLGQRHAEIMLARLLRETGAIA